MLYNIVFLGSVTGCDECDGLRVLKTRVSFSDQKIFIFFLFLFFFSNFIKTRHNPSPRHTFNIFLLN